MMENEKDPFVLAATLLNKLKAKALIENAEIVKNCTHMFILVDRFDDGDKYICKKCGALMFSSEDKDSDDDKFGDDQWD